MCAVAVSMSPARVAGTCDTPSATLLPQVLRVDYALDLHSRQARDRKRGAHPEPRRLLIRGTPTRSRHLSTR